MNVRPLVAIAAQKAALLIIDEQARKTFPDKKKYSLEEKSTLLKWWQGYQKREKSLKPKSDGLAKFPELLSLYGLLLLCRSKGA